MTTLATLGAMTEDELLTGLTQALTIAGWRWTHARRSDLAVTMGDPGWPDLIAVHPLHPGRVLAWELKDRTGRVSPDQEAWLDALRGPAEVDARIVRPADYDEALAEILAARPRRAGAHV